MDLQTNAIVCRSEYSFFGCIGDAIKQIIWIVCLDANRSKVSKQKPLDTKSVMRDQLQWPFSVCVCARAREVFLFPFKRSISSIRK